VALAHDHVGEYPASIAWPNQASFVKRRARSPLIEPAPHLGYREECATSTALTTTVVTNTEPLPRFTPCWIELPNQDRSRYNFSVMKYALRMPKNRVGIFLRSRSSFPGTS
jgi:hypothetical protein